MCRKNEKKEGKRKHVGRKEGRTGRIAKKKKQNAAKKQKGMRPKGYIDPTGPLPKTPLHDLGPMTYPCLFCGALGFKDELQFDGSLGNLCCCHGCV